MCKDSSSQGSDKVSIHSLAAFYRELFSKKDRGKADTIKNADIEVSLKCNDMENTVMSEYLFSVENIMRYLKKLKWGAAPGCDGVSLEHLKFAINTSLSQYLSDILTVCVRYGVLPRSFLWYLSTSSEKKEKILQSQSTIDT